MQPRSKAAIWANDDSIPEAAKLVTLKAGRQPKENEVAEAPEEAAESDEEAELEYQDLPETETRKAEQRNSTAFNSEQPRGKCLISL